MTEIRSSDVELRWRPSSLTRALAAAALVALAVALIGSRWQLVAFVTPLLGVLFSVRWQRPPPAVGLHAEPGVQRCFEGEQVTLVCWTATASDAVTIEVEPVEGARVEVLDRQSGRLTLAISAERWGRYRVDVRVHATGFGGLRDGSAIVAVADVIVFPVAPPQDTPIPRFELLDRLGTHLTRHVGRGVEYADIRTYVAGDQLRAVNWPVSARRGSLHVTERLSERAADVVVLVDTYPQPPGPATDVTERCARGAVQVVQSALRNGDRAGVVALGDRPRWLGVDIGRRQFYKVLDTVLASGNAFETTTGTLVSGPAVPSGAIVVAFSTLLETNFALALIDLCKRGHVVVAVDVLEGLPFAQEQEVLITRMWTMQRAFMYRDMRTIGVDVVSWPSDRTLDQAMRLVPDRRRRTSGPGRT